MKPLKTFYRSPLEHDEEYVTYLGLISARWAMTEEGVCYLLGHLIGAKETARLMYESQGGFRQRIELVKAAVIGQVRRKSLQDALLVALASLYDAFKARNRIVHSPYHAVVETRRNNRVSTPTLRDGEKVLWLGQGHPNKPERINKGVYKNHLEKLDGLLANIVDLTSDYVRHKSQLSARRKQRLRMKPSAHPSPQDERVP